jgi:hypothetical protein
MCKLRPYNFLITSGPHQPTWYEKSSNIGRYPHPTISDIISIYVLSKFRLNHQRNFTVIPRPFSTNLFLMGSTPFGQRLFCRVPSNWNNLWWAQILSIGATVTWLTFLLIHFVDKNVFRLKGVCPKVCNLNSPHQRRLFTRLLTIILSGGHHDTQHNGITLWYFILINTLNTALETMLK